MAERVAVVGSGPSGFYACHALLRAHPDVLVDLYERLPVPYGLVRYGVAPDHAQIKRIAVTFERIAANPRVRFFGGVQATFEELDAAYHAVIWAVGRPLGRTLDLPGAQLEGVFPASDFAYWVNGHPDYAHLDFGLDRVQRVLVVGNGNVAVDVGRLLARRVEELEDSDTPEAVLDQLRRSTVQEVVMMGRRGPDQAAWTAKHIGDLRKLETHRQVEERFLASPGAFLGEQRVEAVELVRNELVEERAVATSETWTEPFQLVIQAIGYRAVELPGLPFGPRGIPHEEGRVLDRPGHYLVGWAKRGPTGAIGVNRGDAKQTVARLLEDLPDLREPAQPRPEQRGLSWADWERVDAEEIRRGQARGKSREKFTSIEELRAAASPPPGTPTSDPLPG